MPSSAKNDVIDLVDVIEEGHPETPNLQPATASSEAGDMLDDLDLEKEIDQIFADLGPPQSKAEQTSADKTQDSMPNALSGTQSDTLPDTLDLDDLFAEQETASPSKTTEKGASGKIQDGPSADFADDFEDLFAQEASDSLEIRESPEFSDSPEIPDHADQRDRGDIQDSPDLQPDSGPDEQSEPAAEPVIAADDLPPEKSPEQQNAEIPETPSQEPDGPAEISNQVTAEDSTVEDDAPQVLDDDLAGEAGDSKTDVDLSMDAEAGSEEMDAVPTDLSTPDQQSRVDVPEPDKGDRSAPVSNLDPDMIKSLVERLDDLEARLAAQEHTEPATPDLTGLLEQVDERIAAAPVLARMAAEHADALQALESKFAAQEQQEPEHQNLESLLAEVEERISVRIDQAVTGIHQSRGQELEELEALRQDNQGVNSRLAQEMKRMAGFEERLNNFFDHLQRQNDGLEAKVAALIEPRIQELTENTADAAASSLDAERENLSREIIAAQEQRLEDFQAVVREQIATAVEQAASSARESANEHVAPHLDEFSARLDGLDSRIQDDREQERREQADMLGKALQDQESRILETIRQEMQTWQTEWESQRSALAKDLENSLNYWTKLQDKFKEMQGEWLAMQEVQAQADPTGTADAQPETSALEEIETRFQQLRVELLDEMRKAVPAAAAQIIREEIQALSQEES